MAVARRPQRAGVFQAMAAMTRATTVTPMAATRWARRTASARTKDSHPPGGQGAAASLSQADAATTTKTSAAQAEAKAKRLRSSRAAAGVLTGFAPRRRGEARR